MDGCSIELIGCSTSQRGSLIIVEDPTFYLQSSGNNDLRGYVTGCNFNAVWATGSKSIIYLDRLPVNGPSGPYTPPAGDGPITLRSGGTIVQAPVTPANTTYVAQSAHGFTVNQCVYYTGSAWALSQANSASTATVYGVVTTVVDANDFIITTGGTGTLGTLTAGTKYYLSDATAGLLTSTAPTSTGSFVVPVLATTTTTQGVIEIGSPASLALIGSSSLAAGAGTKQKTFNFNANGLPFTAGVSIPICVPYGGTIIGYTMTCSPAATGNNTFNLFRSTGTSTLPTASIINSTGGGGGSGTLPTIASGSVAGNSTTLTNWGSTAIAANDVLACYLTPDGTITEATITFYWK
jgi:hypothetical protein